MADESTEYPYRVKLRTGRNVHGARKYDPDYFTTVGWNMVTACGKHCNTEHKRFPDKSVPDDQDVTCTACASKMRV